MQHHPQTPMERINAILGHQPVFPIPRGELWLGNALFQRAGLEDTVDNHFRLAEQLGQEMVCLPVASDLSSAPDLGYRYFEIADLVGVADRGDRCVAVVVDGPFQALVNQKGLMDVLLAWVRRRQELVEAYAHQQAQTTELIARCLGLGIHVVVLADDLAADRGPLISPADIESLCASFYLQAIRTIHEAEGLAFIHCCGRINQLMPLFKQWGMDGMAAVQHCVNDFGTFRHAWGAPLWIMAGIDAELLESDPPPSSALTSLDHLVTSLAPEGGLILCSAGGLYRGEFLPRIKRLYAHVDRLIKR
jgi:uroporphyrinogen decarboxylase